METTSTQTAQQACLQKAQWYHAITLAERIASLRPEEMTASSPDLASNKQGLKKLQRWKEQAPFEKGSLFADRLAMDNITEEDLLALLAEPIEALQERLAQTSPPG